MYLLQTRQDNKNRKQAQWTGLDPRGKIIFTILFILSVIFTDLKEPLSISIAVLLVISITCFSHVPLVDHLKKISLIAPMIILSTILLPFHSFAPPAVSESAWLLIFDTVPLYKSGFIHFLEFLFKSFLILNMTLVLVTSISFTVLLQALQTMNTPIWVLAVLSFLMRLIQLLSEELTRIHMAYSSRHIKMPYYKKISILAKMMSVYFIRIFERSDRTYLAMISRGFNGQIPMQVSLQWRAVDSIFITMTMIFTLLVFLWI